MASVPGQYRGLGHSGADGFAVGQFNDKELADPLDHDGDGVPNMFDLHYMPAPGFTDNDRDRLHDDTNDANPGNITGSNHHFIDDRNGDGYHDDDQNRDGFHDDDMNRDGFHDDDMDRDGFHDNDMNGGMRGMT